MKSLLDHGFYFASCAEFVDLMEFRYGYCLFNSDGSPEGLTSCIRATFADQGLNHLIESTCISCWTTDPGERFARWEIYGKAAPAIRISVDRDGLVEHVKKEAQLNTHWGDVTYGGVHSKVQPQFLSENNTTSDRSRTNHLFFHKHEFYRWEKEFRITFEHQGPKTIPLEKGVIKQVTLSPFGRFSPALMDSLQSLQSRFAVSIRPSELKQPYTEG